MSEKHSELFNLVILPTSAAGEAEQRFLLSATRNDRRLRLVSPDWTAAEVRAALAVAGASNVQMEELFRGNRMASGGRSTQYLFFTQMQLELAGLAPFVAAEESDATLASSTASL